MYSGSNGPVLKKIFADSKSGSTNGDSTLMKFFYVQGVFPMVVVVGIDCCLPFSLFSGFPQN